MDTRPRRALLIGRPHGVDLDISIVRLLVAMLWLIGIYDISNGGDISVEIVEVRA